MNLHLLTRVGTCDHYIVQREQSVTLELDPKSLCTTPLTWFTCVVIHEDAQTVYEGAHGGVRNEAFC